MIEKNTFNIVTNEGKTIECFVVFTHFNETFKKHYVVYTPTQQTNGATQLYASTYILSDDGVITELQKIESNEEWNMIESKIKELQDAIKRGDW